MKKLILMSLLAFFCMVMQAQDIVSLSGKVYDAETGEPLKAASVSLRGSDLSIVTNSEGIFTFKIPWSEDAVIMISHLGYLTSEVPVTDFSKGTRRIAMIPYSIRIDAAVVSAHDALALVQSALMRVRDNYPMDHTGMTSFYRELIRKGSGKYIVLNEAIVDIDKAPTLSYIADKAAIYKGRGSVNYDSTDSLAVNFQGGITSILDYDQVHNTFLGVNITQLGEYYSFTMAQPVILDDRTLLTVEFNQLPQVDDFFYRGKVFIDSESLAIARVELNFNVERDPEAASRLFVVKIPAKYRTFINQAGAVVNYREYDGKWYYDYARIQLDFSVRRNRSIFRQNYTVTGEIAITDHRNGRPVLVSNVDRVRYRDILSEKVSDFTDPEFWGDYNVIEPDEDINAVVRRIIRQLNRRLQ
ncbi:MAG: carboxypeptidase-like regulatory domain-containing protein [Bacteroidales bacterium]|nr:carboxypeptidase-like regulatory domain-containing protein [Bacteroidales bacterium]